MSSKKEKIQQVKELAARPAGQWSPDELEFFKHYRVNPAEFAQCPVLTLMGRTQFEITVLKSLQGKIPDLKVIILRKFGQPDIIPDRKFSG